MTGTAGRSSSLSLIFIIQDLTYRKCWCWVASLGRRTARRGKRFYSKHKQFNTCCRYVLLNSYEKQTTATVELLYNRSRSPRWFSWKPRNLLTCWDASSNPGKWDFSSPKNTKTKQNKKCPKSGDPHNSTSRPARERNG